MRLAAPGRIEVLAGTSTERQEVTIEDPAGMVIVTATSAQVDRRALNAVPMAIDPVRRLASAVLAKTFHGATSAKTAATALTADLAGITSRKPQATSFKPAEMRDLSRHCGMWLGACSLKLEACGSAMKRTTHLLMGAALAVPVAAALPVIGALGSLWLGMTGGALPDYLDLKSDARHSLKHRGVSHSLLVVGLVSVFAWFVLGALDRAEYDLFPVPDRYVLPWTVSLALGMLSHLIGDACTRGGIQPVLPLIKKRFWILPRFLRSRSEGRINVLAMLI